MWPTNLITIRGYIPNQLDFIEEENEGLMVLVVIDKEVTVIKENIFNALELK